MYDVGTFFRTARYSEVSTNPKLYFEIFMVTIHLTVISVFCYAVWRSSDKFCRLVHCLQRCPVISQFYPRWVRISLLKHIWKCLIFFIIHNLEFFMLIRLLWWCRWSQSCTLFSPYFIRSWKKDHGRPGKICIIIICSVDATCFSWTTSVTFVASKNQTIQISYKKLELLNQDFISWTS